jgi:hypothetical protein
MRNEFKLEKLITNCSFDGSCDRPAIYRVYNVTQQSALHGIYCEEHAHMTLRAYQDFNDDRLTSEQQVAALKEPH